MTYPKEIKNVLIKMRVVSSHTNWKILSELDKHHETSVGELQRALGLGQCNTSQRLSVLRKHNLVTRRIDGRNAWYGVNYKELNRVLDLVRFV